MNFSESSPPTTQYRIKRLQYKIASAVLLNESFQPSFFPARAPWLRVASDSRADLSAKNQQTRTEPA
jgi:hypothetical protein